MLFAHSTLCLCFNKDTEQIMEKNLREARCQLEKRESEIEQRTKELHDLRDSVKTAEKEKFEELDKVCFKVVVEFFECDFFMFKEVFFTKDEILTRDRYLI